MHIKSNYLVTYARKKHAVDLAIHGSILKSRATRTPQQLYLMVELPKEADLQRSMSR